MDKKEQNDERGDKLDVKLVFDLLQFAFARKDAVPRQQACDTAYDRKGSVNE